MVESTISIFISYRREDSRHVAGRLADRLQDHFKLFMDTDTIEPGVDFGRAVRREVGDCDVLLAVIGTRWISAVDDWGRRRLDDPNDWVVEEIRTALLRDIRVIPVLVDGAEMPRLVDLPPSLAPLSARQALALRHESFSADVNWLITIIQRMARNDVPTSAPSAGPPVPVDQAPPPGAGPRDQHAPAVAKVGSALPESPRPAAPRRSSRVLTRILVFLGILIGLVILIILGIVVLQLT